MSLSVMPSGIWPRETGYRFKSSGREVGLSDWEALRHVKVSVHPGFQNRKRSSHPKLHAPSLDKSVTVSTRLPHASCFGYDLRHSGDGLPSG